MTPRPGVEPATFRSRVRRRTAAPPRQQHSSSPKFQTIISPLPLFTQHVYIICMRWCDAGKDYCGPLTTYDERRGEIHWPVTEAGLQRIVHCPYAYRDALYASFDCLTTENHTVRWQNLENGSCPAPPFSRGIDLLHKSVVSIYDHFKIRNWSHIITHLFFYSSSCFP